MLLTITSTAPPATDLGYLLHKHPERVHSVSLAFGHAYVFFPEASAERCTAALLLDVDPVGIVRGPGRTLDQYVNDRPYAASSLLSVALARAFGTALGGRSKERQSVADAAGRFHCTVTPLPCRGGEPMLRRLFEPLGYAVEARPHVLDARVPEWGESPYFTVELDATHRLRDLLAHLYVLIPVLDDDKHYWVGDDEVKKLLARGKGWLETHPERELIVRRYLRHQRSLARQATAQLLGEDDADDPDTLREAHDREEAGVEQPIHLNEQRIGSVVAVLKAAGARTVVDLGCGEGRLLQALRKDRTLTRIVGVDVSHRTLEKAAERLHLERLAPAERARIALLHGSLLYRDRRLEGFDAATLIEVIEHLDPARLAAGARALFACARPRVVVLTTPNREYNVHWSTLPAGTLRHADHRFEWTRAELQSWATAVADRWGYQVRFLPVGPEDARTGAPTQLALFTRAEPGGAP
jgi:3' terminal RNA ribose 2'-O-methyltransferase Hen1